MAKNRNPYEIREWLEELTNTYCTSSSHDALSHLTKFPYHLIVIEVGTLKERTHQLIQIIRKITKIPILVIMRGDKEKSFSYVESGADMAVKEASSREDILSYVYALTRRYLSWSENNKKTDNILQYPRAGDIIKSVRNVGYYLDPIKEENT